MTEASYYHYWGKAQKDSAESGEPYHLLIHHSLDVAAVAHEWWQKSPVIQRAFLTLNHQDAPIIHAWLLFFIALHDLGKLDVRFQMKAPYIATNLWHDFADSDPTECKGYYHGEYSYHWFYNDFAAEFAWQTTEWEEAEGAEIWEHWKPWLQAVAGHHGVEPHHPKDDPEPKRAAPAVVKHDRTARKSMVYALEALFLTPVGLSLHDKPPACNLLFLAGFCSVCDWLGSIVQDANGNNCFSYVADHPNSLTSLDDYFQSRRPIAKQLLVESGLLPNINPHVTTSNGMQTLFPKFTPHHIQTVVNAIPVTAGLTLIEAPTGSGKTEAALAYASHLLAAGIAESIIFALPTQATANAMLERLISVSKNLYQDTDLVLAHGKARFNDLFVDLKKAATPNPTQNETYELEASIQCSQWLSQSRKRVFLGQIGVCTVDQVLISVLAVKHRFVRAFGLGKSVLIIDEVHAYDSYMYGLLNKVLIQQREANGSVILLSATLPLFQRQELMTAWSQHNISATNVLTEDNAYPLISHYAQTNNQPTLYPLQAAEKAKLAQAKQRIVTLTSIETVDMLPHKKLLTKIIQAASDGANVVVICNLVADAQTLASALRQQTTLPIDLFHSRYRFKDRQTKESDVLKNYGKGKGRKQGGILIATQVVEQSLDLDFDWMITQLCPMDLFFQRLGRLHRHQRQRPAGFEQPHCTVLLPENEDYQLHKLIYGNNKAPNARVLWRTEQLIKRTIANNHASLIFPDVYRPMIEDVYREAAWDDEPEAIIDEYALFEMEEMASRMVANYVTDIEKVWDDKEEKVNALTRDGEMSLMLVPIVKQAAKRHFLEEKQPISAIDEWRQREEIMLNTIPVPATWESSLKEQCVKEEGIFYFTMTKDDKVWRASGKKFCFSYSTENGLEREKYEPTH